MTKLSRNPDGHDRPGVSAATGETARRAGPSADRYRETGGRSSAGPDRQSMHRWEARGPDAASIPVGSAMNGGRRPWSGTRAA